MRVFVAVGAMVALGLSAWACGGSSYSGGTGVNPTSPTPSVAGVVTINVVAVKGAQSLCMANSEN